MSNIDQIIDYTKTFQDIELTTAIDELKNNPTQLQQFLQDQQGRIYSDVIQQKDSTFDKVYGDLNRVSESQSAIIMLDKRNQELLDIQKQIYNKQKKSATNMIDDKNIYNRKYEMNQWTVNNKKETLFIFSMLFIVLSALVLFTTLWRMNIISSSLASGLSIPFVVVFILTVVYRTNYTNIYRDKRYWNRNNFNQKYGKIPVPLCPQALQGIESGISGLQSDLSSGVSSTENEIKVLNNTFITQ